MGLILNDLKNDLLDLRDCLVRLFCDIFDAIFASTRPMRFIGKWFFAIPLCFILERKNFISCYKTFRSGEHRFGFVILKATYDFNKMGFFSRIETVAQCLLRNAEIEKEVDECQR